VPGRLFLLIVASFACGAPGPSRVPATVAPWLKADPHRCLFIRDLLVSMETMARRCAEEFISQNGYTDVPPTDDSTRWVLEGGEGGSWPRVLEARGSSLEREGAAVQCSVRRCIVLFRLRRSVLACAYRAVSMTQVFTRLRLEAGAIQDSRCGQRRA
jgi:hypothetical protein